MILQYFKKKENKEQIIATKQYKKILYDSNKFLEYNEFFQIKDFKTSFEIVSIFLIMFIRKNLSEVNKKKYLKLIPYAWEMINHRFKEQNQFNNLMLLLKNNFPKFIR